MQNPLTKEQIKELKKISKLPLHQQKTKLQEFLKNLTPEQIEFLKKQQKPQQCIFCQIAQKKIKSNIIYENKQIIATLDINPANIGHTLIFPKEHYQTLSQIPKKELNHLFNIINKLSKKIQNKLKSQGITIYIPIGQAAGQYTPHITIHIIPRTQNDNIIFNYQPLKISDKELRSVAKLLKIQQTKKIKKTKYKEPTKIP